MTGIEIALALTLQAVPDGALQEWTLEASGSTRWRYESLSGQFRAGRDGNDQALSGRTLFTLNLSNETVSVLTELSDSRVYLTDRGSAVSTSNVNTFDILQAAIQLDLEAVGLTTRAAELTFGRMTIDLGSRRYVGRNGFRNTRNAFTGARLIAELDETTTFTGFYVSPVSREPSDLDALLDNEQAFDEENWDVRFWAAHLDHEVERLDARLETYLYGLYEQDGADRPSADRELLTAGFRFRRAPQVAAFDFEVEHGIQWGQRSADRTVGAPTLDVFAQTHHAHLGFTFDHALSPRVALEYEYASGEEADDGEWSRWDPLFGLRRTDFGQTGIHGPLRRQNVSAPGVRVSIGTDRFDARFLAKAAWLASDEDPWAGAGVVDPSGAAGARIGTHFSTRLRYWAVPNRLRLEAGGAVFDAGEFAENAPNATGEGDTVFGYLQVTASF